MSKKIVLFCNAGMSTSLLVNKMKAAAKELDFDCEIDAYSTGQEKEYGKDADVILLAPQVRYHLKKVQSIFPDNPIAIIEMMDYGRVDGMNVLKTALNLLEDDK